MSPRFGSKTILLHVAAISARPRRLVLQTPSRRCTCLVPALGAASITGQQRHRVGLKLRMLANISYYVNS